MIRNCGQAKVESGTGEGNGTQDASPAVHGSSTSTANRNIHIRDNSLRFAQARREARELGAGEAAISTQIGDVILDREGDKSLSREAWKVV